MRPTLSTLAPTEVLLRAGFRFGPRGTQSSRTIMLRELTELFAVVPPDAGRDAYTDAVVEENALGKATLATRQTSRQRLAEMYGLDPRLALFRVLRRLWDADRTGRPLLAILCALARDPLLRATAAPVLVLDEGEPLIRPAFESVLRESVGARFNDASLANVASRAASSWTQSGHLGGRMRKVRRRIEATPGALSLALWLGEVEGLAGLSLLGSHWTAVLDLSGPAALPVALEARRQGLIRARAAGNIIEIDAQGLDIYRA